MNYSLLLHTETGAHTLPISWDDLPACAEITCDGIAVTLTVWDTRGIRTVTLTASSDTPRSCYFSLYGKGDGTIYSFDGACTEEHLFRQSPHDYQSYHFRMDGTAVPMIAVCHEKTDLFVSDQPGHCDNDTTQHILPQNGECYLSSGDPGGSPNFEGDPFLPRAHAIGDGQTHTFRFFYRACRADTLKAIRREAFLLIDDAVGDACGNLYHAICFGSNYMHYRVNESGSSRFWIVAGIQYANCQYARDSFYQTWILPAEMEEECYHAFRESWVQRAENPLFYLIWSYRVARKGGTPNLALAKNAFDIMMTSLHKGPRGDYLPQGDEHGAFRNWFDICCYEFDDVDAYSQGLCVCALRAAKALGFDIGDEYEAAKAQYLSLYHDGYLPLSRKKPWLSLDVCVGDLLHALLFGETILPDDIMRSTYRRVMESKAVTPHGIKVVSAPDGEYLPIDAYGAYGFVHPAMAKMDLGRYANGGSYHLYEMMFHIDAHLHGAPDAVDNMIRRLYIDLDFDGATHEYMHTLHGNGVKANQGWNAAIYAMWDALCRDGRGDRRFFDAAEDKLCSL